MARYFSLTGWRTSFGEFCVFRFDFDWLRSSDIPDDWAINGWLSARVGLFGFCGSLTYWPEGKPE